MANPNWVRGMKRVPGSGRTPGGRSKHQKGLEEILVRITKQYQMIVDPAEILLMVGAGIDPRNPESNIPLDIRIDACKATINYFRPKLAQVVHTGADEGPIEFNTKVSQEFSTNAEFRQMAETLIMRTAQIEGATPALLGSADDEDDEEDSEESFIPVEG